MERKLEGTITEAGAIVTVTVRATAKVGKDLHSHGQRVPTPRDVKGILDTGADRCWIRESLLNEMGMQPVGTGDFKTPATQSESNAANVYSVGISLNSDLHLDLIVGGMSHLNRDDVDVILGRDVLSMCRFVFNGIDRSFELFYEAEG